MSDNVRPLKAVPDTSPPDIETLAVGEVVILTCDFKAEVPMTIRSIVKGEPGFFYCGWHDTEKVLNEASFHVDELLVLHGDFEVEVEFEEESKP